MTSIYCEHIDSECFTFHNCYKCEHKPPDFIRESDCKRIAEDARLAIDALSAVVDCSPYLHQNYLKEKLSLAERCIKFMRNFVKDGEKNG